MHHLQVAFVRSWTRSEWSFLLVDKGQSMRHEKLHKDFVQQNLLKKQTDHLQIQLLQELQQFLLKKTPIF